MCARIVCRPCAVIVLTCRGDKSNSSAIFSTVTPSTKRLRRRRLFLSCNIHESMIASIAVRDALILFMCASSLCRNYSDKKKREQGRCTANLLQLYFANVRQHLFAVFANNVDCLPFGNFVFLCDFLERQTVNPPGFENFALPAAETVFVDKPYNIASRQIHYTMNFCD